MIRTAILIFVGDSVQQKMASKGSFADCQENDSAVSGMFEEPSTLSENSDDTTRPNGGCNSRSVRNIQAVQASCDDPAASFVPDKSMQRPLNNLTEKDAKIEKLERGLLQEVENNRKLKETILSREKEKNELDQQKNAEIERLNNTIETMKNKKSATDARYEEEIKKRQAQIHYIGHHYTEQACRLQQKICQLRLRLMRQTVLLKHREKEIAEQKLLVKTRDNDLCKSRQRTAELTADLEIIAREKAEEAKEKAEAKVKILETKLAQQQTQQQPSPPDPTASSATNNSGEGCFEILSTHTRSTAYSSAYKVSTDDDDSQ